MRAGITAFPISPRFSPHIVAHLLNEIRPEYIFMDHKIASNGVADIIFHELSLVSDQWNPRKALLPTYDDLYSANDAFEPLPNHGRDFGKPACIMHSSSTF